MDSIPVCICLLVAILIGGPFDMHVQNFVRRCTWTSLGDIKTSRGDVIFYKTGVSDAVFTSMLMQFHRLVHDG